MKHIEQVFRCQVACRSGGIGTTTKAASRGIDNADTKLHSHQNIGKSRATRIMEVNSQAPGGDIPFIKQQTHDINDLVRCRHADRITQR